MESKTYVPALLKFYPVTTYSPSPDSPECTFLMVQKPTVK